MKKRVISLMVAGLLAGSILTGCGQAQSTTEDVKEEAAEVEEAVEEVEEAAEEVEEAVEEVVEEVPEEVEEYDPMVESIDLTVDNGAVKYVGFEKANPELTDYDNALVFKFEFTNNQSKPAQFQTVFRVKFFQNGAELNDHVTYSSKGGDQYELVGAFFNEAMKGGTVTFGQIVVPKDDSPITIMVERNGMGAEDEYQMMEVNLSGGSDESVETAEEVSAEDIDAALQGIWMLQGNSFTFDNGKVSVVANGTLLDGTYEVNTETGMIDAHFEATDSIVNIHMPYEYADGTLKVFNNDNEELTKQ